MIPCGWNSHGEASNTKHHPGPVEDAMGEKEVIPGGWNKQREASNTHRNPGPVQTALALLAGFFWYRCYYPNGLRDPLFPV